MKRVILIVAMFAAFGLGSAAALAATSDKPPTPPGQGECEHGNSQKPCKEDPQPNHGQDCDEHGNQGGVNEDHCTSESTPTETTPTETTPTDTTPGGTTPTETTPASTTPAQTTPTETTPAGTPNGPPESTPAESPAESTPTETTPTVSGHVFTPPVAQTEAAGTSESVAAVGASAPQPTTAPQAAPFTP